MSRYIKVFALILSTVAVRAAVTPTEPGPGSVFKQGGKCSTAWTGDTDGKSANMAIELMTGDNFKMVHLTTVATGLDGNKDGRFEFDCPEVDPNSAIYFYQYSAPAASGFQWATRFAIADQGGKFVPPPETTQPDGKEIPWGTGKLVDPSTAKPPPDFQNAGSSNSSSPSSASQSSNSTSTSSSLSSTSSASAPVQPLTTTRMTTVVTTQRGQSTGSPSSENTNTNNNNDGTTQNNNNKNNAALSIEYTGTWKTIFMLAVTASTFTFYL